MKIVMASLLSLICFSTHAGVGAHGGNVVTCPRKEAVTIDLLQFSSGFNQGCIPAGMPFTLIALIAHPSIYKDFFTNFVSAP